MTTKSNVRNTREVKKHSVDTDTSADDKNIKECPQIASYIVIKVKPGITVSSSKIQLAGTYMSKSLLLLRIQ